MASKKENVVELEETEVEMTEEQNRSGAGGFDEEPKSIGSGGDGGFGA